MAISTSKIVTGGLAAGVVMAVLDFVTNGFLLREQNEAAMNALNPSLMANMEGAATMVIFIAIDFLFGILLVWTYAMIRPRFGPGPRTATIAAVQLWLVAGAIYAFMVAAGMFTWSYYLIGSVASFVMLVASAQVGAMIYKE